MSRGETEGKWERKIPSRLHAVSAEPNAGLDPTNHEIMTWAEIKSQSLTDWATHMPRKISPLKLQLKILSG